MERLRRDDRPLRRKKILHVKKHDVKGLTAPCDIVPFDLYSLSAAVALLVLFGGFEFVLGEFEIQPI